MSLLIFTRDDSGGYPWIAAGMGVVAVLLIVAAIYLAWSKRS